jgi:Protein of unknown function (DUF2442)
MATNVLDKNLLDEITTALEVSREADKYEPRATSVHYDSDTRKIVLHLKNDSSIAIDAKLIQGLENATDEQRSDVGLEGDGYALHWEALDVDISVPGLVKGIYGTRAWMTHLGQKGGQVKSEAKAEAARANGKRGGRPSKQVKQEHESFATSRSSIKTVDVELPRELIDAAAILARQQGISRNELYQKAIEKYLEEQRASNHVTHSDW